MIELEKLGLKRYNKYNVGKKMGNDLYIHRMYGKLIPRYKVFLHAFNSNCDFNFDIIKWNEKEGYICFIECENFKTEKEPVVGRSFKYNYKKNDFKITNPPKDPLIYHHKWLFVKDNCNLFSIKESKRRSLNIKKTIGVNPKISSRIGRLSYWEDFLKNNNID